MPINYKSIVWLYDSIMAFGQSEYYDSNILKSPHNIHIFKGMVHHSDELTNGVDIQHISIIILNRKKLIYITIFKALSAFTIEVLEDEDLVRYFDNPSTELIRKAQLASKPAFYRKISDLKI